jgi:hypothetical protein
MKLYFEGEKIRSIKLCKICVAEETDNPDGICDDWKFYIVDDKDITPNM